MNKFVDNKIELYCVWVYKIRYEMQTVVSTSVVRQNMTYIYGKLPRLSIKGNLPWVKYKFGRKSTKVLGT